MYLVSLIIIQDDVYSSTKTWIHQLCLQDNNVGRRLFISTFWRMIKKIQFKNKI